MTRFLSWLLGIAEAPSRVRLLESEMAHLRRHVGMLVRAKEAADAEEMERRMRRGLDDARAVMAGHPTAQTTGAADAADAADAAKATGGQP